MIGSWKRAAVASALCMGLAVASAGAAQDRPEGPGGPHGPGPHGGPDRQKMFEEMRLRHETMLHDLLQIKPDQEAAFHAYLTAITPPAKGGKGAPGREHAPGATPMTTPERLDRMAARMAERQARFQTMVAATKTFYAALTPDQRRAFDAMPLMRGGHHERWGGRKGGPWGGAHPSEGPR